MGMATLTSRAWFTATRGEAAWDALYKCPTTDRQDCFAWFRRGLGLPVRNEVTVHAVLPCTGFLLEVGIAREDVAHLRGLIDRFDQLELIGTPFHAPGCLLRT